MSGRVWHDGGCVCDQCQLNRNAAAPMHEIRNALRELTEAVRALKPAPFAQPIEKVYYAALEEHAEQRAEIERLQKVVADQALTIGTLKDENARNLAAPPGLTLSKGLLGANVTAAQLQRLNDLLEVGAVVELGWLVSAAGMRKDSAQQVMGVLAQSGCCEATTLVFHDCAEHPVSTGLIEWPWKCPDCESVLDSDDAGQVHFERRLTLTKAVRFV